MTKLKSLKKLYRKITGTEANGNSLAEVLDELANNYPDNPSTFKIVSYESEFTTSELTTRIPINISQYNKENDFLIVYINRLKCMLNVDYTISSDGDYIELTNGLEENQVVNFTVIKVGV